MGGAAAGVVAALAGCSESKKIEDKPTQASRPTFTPEQKLSFEQSREFFLAGCWEVFPDFNPGPLREVVIMEFETQEGQSLGKFWVGLHSEQKMVQVDLEPIKGILLAIAQMNKEKENILVYNHSFIVLTEKDLLDSSWAASKGNVGLISLGRIARESTASTVSFSEGVNMMFAAIICHHLMAKNIDCPEELTLQTDSVALVTLAAIRQLDYQDYCRLDKTYKMIEREEFIIFDQLTYQKIKENFAQGAPLKFLPASVNIA